MIIKLTRCCHRKAGHAVYALNLHKLEVYLRNNKPARNEWGDFYLSCYLHPNTPTSDNDVIESSFTNYADFREYRAMLYAAHGSDKRLLNKGFAIPSSIQMLDAVIHENIMLTLKKRKK